MGNRSGGGFTGRGKTVMLFFDFLIFEWCFVKDGFLSSMYSVPVLLLSSASGEGERNEVPLGWRRGGGD